MELRYISLRWVLYQAVTILHYVDRVRYSWALSVESWVMAVTVHLLGDIDRIVDSALAVDDGVLAVEGVTENNGVVGVGSGTSRTGSTSDDGGVKTFAWYKKEDKEKKTMITHRWEDV